jgi:hypothetical protein
MNFFLFLQEGKFSRHRAPRLLFCILGTGTCRHRSLQPWGKNMVENNTLHFRPYIYIYIKSENNNITLFNAGIVCVNSIIFWGYIDFRNSGGKRGGRVTVTVQFYVKFCKRYCNLKLNVIKLRIKLCQSNITKSNPLNIHPLK